MCDFTRRAHVCCISDDCGAHGMERNIGDQLNKAFEAYRQVSIEKDNAKKELQKMVTKQKENFLCELCVMELNIANIAQMMSHRAVCCQFLKKVLCHSLVWSVFSHFYVCPFDCHLLYIHTVYR